MIKIVAIYLRLSKDDCDKDDESNSISNQRSIIKKFISNDTELCGMTLTEFSDDGFTGTNFERPGVKRLLESVRKGEISCVLVKDFSRFGRNYLEVSKLIDLVFPYLDVRFVAVTDRYDSNNHKGTTADFDVAFRNLTNALYSRDISVKVKSAKRAKALKGMNINPFAPYGYKKSEADKHRLEIDEPAAEVIRRIFDMYSKGQKVIQIARVLNEESVLTPNEYKKKNGSNIKINSITGSLWTNYAIYKIINNEQYLGVCICNKKEKTAVGSKKTKSLPKEKWIQIQNAHPAIISKEIWDAVHSKKATVNFQNRKKPDSDKILFRRVICGYCGHVMKHKCYMSKRSNEEYRYFTCTTSGLTDNYNCSGKHFIAQTLEDAVKDAVKTRLLYLINLKKLCRAGEKSINKRTEVANKKVNLIDIEIDRLEANKLLIYDSHKRGSISVDIYLKKREEILASIKVKRLERTAVLSDSQQQNEMTNTAYQHLFKYEDYENDTDPSDKLVNLMVEAVYVFDSDRIEIKFKFADELNEIENQIKKLIR